MPVVKLFSVTGREGPGPEETSAFGALGCFEQDDSFSLYQKLAGDQKKVKGVLKNSAGRGHGSVQDQNLFIFSIRDLSRAATLQLCLPQYLMHLQQSLRRANADRGFHVPEGMSRESTELMSDAFRLYEKMKEEGIPGEDARYILPLYTKTNIQTAGNARELSHLFWMTEHSDAPSEVKAVVRSMRTLAEEIAPNLFRDWGYNYEALAWYPSAQLYSDNPVMDEIVRRKGAGGVRLVEYDIPEEQVSRAVLERDEAILSVLKHSHNGGSVQGFLARMSLAAFHQAIRQRTWDQAVESVFSAAERGELIIPRTVRARGFEREFTELARSMLIAYREEKERIGRHDAIGVVPHALALYDLIHVNGWNAIHSIGKRTCMEAQWEIREIAAGISRIIKEKNPAIGRWSEPQGVVYGYCPERNPCGYCEKVLDNRGKKRGGGEESEPEGIRP